MPRKYPNLIITGTPGTGKTTTSTHLLELSQPSTPADTTTPHIPLKLLNINQIAKKHNFYDSYDEELQTHVVDEDKLLDHIEELIQDGGGEGGWVIDWHVCDVFPERWIDLVVVLRCDDTNVFYERLAAKKSTAASESTDGTAAEGRGYTGKKLEENIDAEIFGTIADEAKEAWPDEGRVVELRSVEPEDIEANAERILEWCRNWTKDQAQESKDG